jgi:hypothetical protein
VALDALTMGVTGNQTAARGCPDFVEHLRMTSPVPVTDEGLQAEVDTGCREKSRRDAASIIADRRRQLLLEFGWHECHLQRVVVALESQQCRVVDRSGVAQRQDSVAFLVDEGES